MIINDKSKIINFNAQRTNDTDFYIPENFKTDRRNVTKINNIPYYFKNVSVKEMINELIGTYYSKILQIESANYQIGISNNKIYALSQLFFKNGYDYMHTDKYYNTTAYELLTKRELEISKYYLKQIKMLQKVKNITMLEKILKLTAIDLKTGQVDRNDNNVILKIDQKTNIVDLEALYDFSESYQEEMSSSELKYYDSPFIILRKNYLSLYHFAKQYPDFINYIETLVNVPICDILTQIENDFDILLTDQEKEYYEERDNSYTELLKKII